MKQISIILFFFTILKHCYSNEQYRLLMQNNIINADIWSHKPQILFTGLGFQGIIGLDPPFSEEDIRAIGGSLSRVQCEDGRELHLTSVVPVGATTIGYNATTFNADAYPLVFSWPVLSETVQNTDILIELNNGTEFHPRGISIVPNDDFNERNVLVLIHPKTSNRLAPEEKGSIYPVRVRIVDELQLLGPYGPVSVNGFNFRIKNHPYRDGTEFLAAKLSLEESVDLGGFHTPPNDGSVLYGERAQYRLRLLTSHGISPDGIIDIRPDQYELYFVVVLKYKRKEIYLREAGIIYDIDGYKIEVVGLAEVGGLDTPLDDCYNSDDRDNRIDIVLSGDEEAIRLIKYVDIPSEDPYLPLYNPGGPGLDPTPGTRYTQPTKPQRVRVTMALDDPMTVTFNEDTLKGKREKKKRKRKKNEKKNKKSRKNNKDERMRSKNLRVSTKVRNQEEKKRMACVLFVYLLEEYYGSDEFPME